LSRRKRGKSRWTEPKILVPIIVVVITVIVGPIVVPIIQDLLKQRPKEQVPPQQIGCGTHPPGATLFGSWRWSGTVDGTSESGSFTFNNDCTYTAKVTKSGFTTNDEGTFLVSSSPDASITLTNKNSGQKHTYIISKISENSFHASSPDYTVNLDFFRAT
jgi:hypothetical protein